MTPVFYYLLTGFGGKKPSPKQAAEVSHPALEPVGVGADSDV
jgi:hypothetical protein